MGTYLRAGIGFAAKVIVSALIAISFFHPAPAFAVTCAGQPTTDGITSFTVTITGSDGSCPKATSYDGVGRMHIDLSDTITYKFVLSNCSGSQCPVNKVWVGGPIASYVCGNPTPSCGPSTGPWTFTLNTIASATSQCGTLPIKVEINSGTSILQAESGIGCTASNLPRSVPEFPVGLALVLAVALPSILVLRRRILP